MFADSRGVGVSGMPTSANFQNYQDTSPSKIQKKFGSIKLLIFPNCEALICCTTEDGRSMTTFYYYSVNHQSGLHRNTFSKLSYIFFNTSKCAANCVISFEVYDGFIGQKILKL